MQKSNKQKMKSRRDFIKKAAIASSIFIIPRHVLGGVGYTAPSDQLVIAGIGVGGKGQSDLWNAYTGKKDAFTKEGKFNLNPSDKKKNIRKERVVALCDVDPKGKHGVVESINNFPDANFYEDFRIMLDKEKDIDAVIISTPDHTHAVITMDAMLRGKHVYVQKPLTHNIYEARLLRKTAKKNKIVTQMGNQGASSPGRPKVQEWIDAKLIGNIKQVNMWSNRPVWPQGIPIPDEKAKKEGLNWDLWLGPAQKRPYANGIHPFNWRGWWEYGTGALGDMGCHIMDTPLIVLGLKYPKNVECSVGSVYKKMWTPEYLPEACPPSSKITLNYDATEKNPIPIKVTWSDGGIRPSRPELIPSEDTITPGGNGNGVIMIGEKGIITCGAYGLYPKLYRKGEPTLKLDISEEELSNMWKIEFGHQQKWIEACKAGFDSDEHKKLTSSFDIAGPVTENVLMGNIAIRSYSLRKEIKDKENDRNGYEYIGQKRLDWNGENMKVTNLDEANQFVARTYREGWKV